MRITISKNRKEAKIRFKGEVKEILIPHTSAENTLSDTSAIHLFHT